MSLTLGADSAGLLFDYVPWEQMTKQRRGIMWAMQQARNFGRTLVLPPLRFHTSTPGEYEYTPYSELFDMKPLASVHPIAELSGVSSSSHVDVVFSVLRGQPPPKGEDAGVGGVAPPGKKKPSAAWVAGKCSAAGAEPKEECEPSALGETTCTTTHLFAGIAVRVANLTCGWAPDMRWDQIMRSADVRPKRLVGVQGIVYQIPPPSSMVELAAYASALAAGHGDRSSTCGWRCPYQHLRAAMVYRSSLIDDARRFLAEARRGAAASRRQLLLEGGSGEETRGLHSAEHGEDADGDGAARARVLGVHWRRGDFLTRAGVDLACVDVATGAPLGPGGHDKQKCPRATVVLGAKALAAEARAWLAQHDAKTLFLATNADAADVAALEAELQGVRVVTLADLIRPGGEEAYSQPQLAVLDTIVCALADAFLGTRRSMFSWNILEERILQGKGAKSGGLMGLPSAYW
jgi:hypothetical protein